MSEQKTFNKIIVKKITPDDEIQLVRERMGIKPLKFLGGLNVPLPSYLSNQEENPEPVYIWPKHTNKELFDLSQPVYQYDRSELNWSIRYKALGCYNLMPDKSNMESRSLEQQKVAHVASPRAEIKQNAPDDKMSKLRNDLFLTDESSSSSSSSEDDNPRLQANAKTKPLPPKESLKRKVDKPNKQQNSALPQEPPLKKSLVPPPQPIKQPRNSSKSNEMNNVNQNPKKVLESTARIISHHKSIEHNKPESPLQDAHLPLTAPPPPPPSRPAMPIRYCQSFPLNRFEAEQLIQDDEHLLKEVKSLNENIKEDKLLSENIKLDKLLVEKMFCGESPPLNKVDAEETSRRKYRGLLVLPKSLKASVNGHCVQSSASVFEALQDECLNRLKEIAQTNEKAELNKDTDYHTQSVDNWKRVVSYFSSTSNTTTTNSESKTLTSHHPLVNHDLVSYCQNLFLAVKHVFHAVQHRSQDHQTSRDSLYELIVEHLNRLDGHMARIESKIVKRCLRFHATLEEINAKFEPECQWPRLVRIVTARLLLFTHFQLNRNKKASSSKAKRKLEEKLKAHKMTLADLQNAPGELFFNSNSNGKENNTRIKNEDRMALIKDIFQLLQASTNSCMDTGPVAEQTQRVQELTFSIRNKPDRGFVPFCADVSIPIDCGIGFVSLYIDEAIRLFQEMIAKLKEKTCLVVPLQVPSSAVNLSNSSVNLNNHTLSTSGAKLKSSSSDEKQSTKNSSSTTVTAASVPTNTVSTKEKQRKTLDDRFYKQIKSSHSNNFNNKKL